MKDFKFLKIIWYMKKLKENYEYVVVPDKIYTQTIVTIKCKKHNIIIKVPHKRHLLSESGLCPECKRLNRVTTTTETLVKRFKEVHNNKFDYGKVIYNGPKEKVIITCRIHGDFLQLPSSHLRGCGCRRCKNSNGEKLLQKFLTKMNISFDTQKCFYGCVNKKTNKMLPFDIYVEEFHTCIEYDGYQHFIPVEIWGGENALKEVKSRDRIKNKYCKDNDINLIRIPYTTPVEEIVKILNDSFQKDYTYVKLDRLKWVDRNIREYVKDFKYRGDIHKIPGLYSYLRKHKLLDEVLGFLNHRVTYYDHDLAKKMCNEITEYGLIEKNHSGLMKYLKKHNLMYLTDHMIKYKTYHTDEELVQELGKYTYKMDVRKNNPNLYAIALSRGFIHLLKDKTIWWNRETVVEAFNKCTSTSEFAKRFRGAENYARKHKFYYDLIKNTI